MTRKEPQQRSKGHYISLSTRRRHAISSEGVGSGFSLASGFSPGQINVQWRGAGHREACRRRDGASELTSAWRLAHAGCWRKVYAHPLLSVTVCVFLKRLVFV